MPRIEKSYYAFAALHGYAVDITTKFYEEAPRYRTSHYTPGIRFNSREEAEAWVEARRAEEPKPAPDALAIVRELLATYPGWKTFHEDFDPCDLLKKIEQAVE